MSITNAVFSLSGYRFEKVMIDLSGLASSPQAGIDINPSGSYREVDNTFNLKFNLSLRNDDKTFIAVECCASFVFSGNVSFADIPDYFYSNCIAIIFPYVRAFVSTITLQANIGPVILPTFNLLGLSEELKKHTVVDE